MYLFIGQYFSSTGRDSVCTFLTYQAASKSCDLKDSSHISFLEFWQYVFLCISFITSASARYTAPILQIIPSYPAIMPESVLAVSSFAVNYTFKFVEPS